MTESDLKVGTRVRVNITNHEEWSRPERFDGQTGEITHINTAHWNGREHVPSKTRVFVKFDTPVDAGWGNVSHTGFWFDWNEVEVHQ